MENLKLLKEYSIFKFPNKLLQESLNKNGYVLKGVVISTYKKNVNNRIYSRQFWEKVLDKFKDQIPGSPSLIDHPTESESPEGSVTRIGGVWKKVYLTDDCVCGDLKLLGPYKDLIIDYINEGGQLGISMVGFGQYDHEGYVDPDTYILLRIGDIVLSPSNMVSITSDKVVSEEKYQEDNIKDNTMETKPTEKYYTNYMSESTKVLKKAIQNQKKFLLRETQKDLSQLNLFKLIEYKNYIDDLIELCSSQGEDYSDLEKVRTKLEETISSKYDSNNENSDINKYMDTINSIVQEYRQRSKQLLQKLKESVEERDNLVQEYKKIVNENEAVKTELVKALENLEKLKESKETSEISKDYKLLLEKVLTSHIKINKFFKRSLLENASKIFALDKILKALIKGTSSNKNVQIKDNNIILEYKNKIISKIPLKRLSENLWYLQAFMNSKILESSIYPDRAILLTPSKALVLSGSKIIKHYKYNNKEKFLKEKDLLFRAYLGTKLSEETSYQDIETLIDKVSKQKELPDKNYHFLSTDGKNKLRVLTKKDGVELTFLDNFNKPLTRVNIKNKKDLQKHKDKIIQFLKLSVYPHKKQYVDKEMEDTYSTNTETKIRPKKKIKESLDKEYFDIKTDPQLKKYKEKTIPVRSSTQGIAIPPAEDIRLSYYSSITPDQKEKERLLESIKEEAFAPLKEKIDYKGMKEKLYGISKSEEVSDGIYIRKKANKPVILEDDIVITSPITESFSPKKALDNRDKINIIFEDFKAKNPFLKDFRDYILDSNSVIEATKKIQEIISRNKDEKLLLSNINEDKDDWLLNFN